MNGAINDIFATLEHAAVMGERCPVNGEAGFDGNDLAELAAAGRIKNETYAHNFRVITVLVGQYAGRSTAPPPKGRKPKRPWRVIDADGTHYPLKAERMAATPTTHRRQPSAPRPLSSARGDAT